MKVFVTGGAGYVGSHCARRLRAAGHSLLVYDNLSTGHRAAVPADELCVGDLGDIDQVRKTLTEFRPDAVMHFAASTAVGESVDHPLDYYRNNVSNTVTLLDAAEQLGIKKLVFSSSCAVYGPPPSTPITEDMPTNPISPYGRTKRIMEMVLDDCATAWDLGFAALRYFNAAGAADDGSIGEHHDDETHLIPIVLQAAIGQRDHVRLFGTDYDTPDGTCIRDYIHVEDLAEAHLKALLALEPGRRLILNLGTGAGHSVTDVIATARRITGRDIKVVEAPRRPGDCPVLYADPTLAQTTLDWKARWMDLGDIVTSAWRWHQAHPNGF